MNRSNSWKLIFTALLTAISISLILPFEDQELGDYALTQVTSDANASDHAGHEKFSEVIDNLRLQLPSDQPIDFAALRDYGKRNRLDFSAYFEPPQGVLGTVGSRIMPMLVKPGIRSSHIKDRDKRNDLVLRTLLKKSQAAIKRGLDLRGGIAFTMEATDLNVSTDLDQASGASPMDKVVEIMSERLNAFGVAETVVRKKGDRAIEVQIPDLTTKQDPGIIDELQKPAKLEFRIVNTNSEAPMPVQEGEEWTDDEGIPYIALLRSDAQPNERPIWVRRLWSADGEIISEAYPRQDQMGGWEVGLDFTTEGGKLFLGIINRFIILKFLSNLTGIIIINISLRSFDFVYLNTGLISQFLVDLFTSINLNLADNNFIYFIINFLLLVFGVVLIFLSFRINFSWINKLFSFLKVFKYFKFLFSVFSLFKYISFRNKITKKTLRSEPTIKKRNYVNLSKKNNNSPKAKKQLELDNFSFSLPSKNLLSKSNLKNNKNRELEKINTNAAIKLEKTLSEYGVEGKIVGFSSGPIVTLFEFIPNAGIKSSKVIGLSDDIARAMSSISARISTQPGKTSLGIEIPNTKRDSVLFGDLIEEDEFEIENDSLTLALGKDISGKSIFANLERMPHLLIAGTTGSGKSVALNAMLMSILYKATPQQVRLVLIDPKMLELSVYEDLPHLLCPVITDMAQAAFGLRWCVNEMERRYKLMAAMSVRNLNGFNAKVKKANESGNPIKDPTFKIDEEKGISEADIPNLQELPQIVIAVDELADLMMVVGKKVEQLIARLAQKARAAGIHMLLATQRPSVDVITGLIKANISARMAFNVASSMDSRVVLDQVGAEQLLGRGDMLYVGSGTSVPLRVHGAFVGEEEIIRVVKDWKDKETVSYLDAVTKAPETGEDSEGSEDSEKDEFYDQAVAFVVESRRASISAVQRKFRIGYNRAARLIEAMESAGLVSEMNSNGNREVLAPSNAE